MLFPTLKNAPKPLPLNPDALSLVSEQYLNADDLASHKALSLMLLIHNRTIAYPDAFFSNIYLAIFQYRYLAEDASLALMLLTHNSTIPGKFFCASSSMRGHATQNDSLTSPVQILLQIYPRKSSRAAETMFLCDLHSSLFI